MPLEQLKSRSNRSTLSLELANNGLDFDIPKVTVSFAVRTRFNRHANPAWTANETRSLDASLPQQNRLNYVT
jgi:hypothetical protein